MLKKILTESNKNILTLSTGTTIAQSIPVLVSPILRKKLSNVNNYSYIHSQIIKDFKEHNFFDIKENDFNGLFAFWILNIFLNDKSKR